MRHECTKELRERYTNYASATRVRNFDLDNDTSESIFSRLYINYVANEKLEGQEQFHSNNYLLEMPRSHAKLHLKSTPQKLNFVMVKSYIKKLRTRL